MKMPIKLLLKIYDTMVVPILLYGAEVWAASSQFTPDKWDKTEIEKQHTSLLKQILGLNRSRIRKVTSFTQCPCEGVELFKIP